MRVGSVHLREDFSRLVTIFTQETLVIISHSIYKVEVSAELFFSKHSVTVI